MVELVGYLILSLSDLNGEIGSDRVVVLLDMDPASNGVVSDFSDSAIVLGRARNMQESRTVPNLLVLRCQLACNGHQNIVEMHKAGAAAVHIDDQTKALIINFKGAR